jgi:DNA-binding MarR family transcriptional regulator
MNQGETRTESVRRIESELMALRRRIERSRFTNGQGTDDLPVDKAAYVMLRQLEGLGTTRLSTLAHYFGLDVSTMSRHVAALESEGLIERVPDPADGRAQLLQVTAAGADLCHRQQEHKCALIAERLHAWSDQDCQTFVELLRRYNQAMEPSSDGNVTGSTTGDAIAFDQSSIEEKN